MFPNLKNTKIENRKDRLSAGVHAVTIKAFKSSKENPEYQGTPYMEFTAEDNSGAVAYLKFGAIDEHTSEAAARVRTEIFKQFLMNAGVTMFDTPEQASKDAVGKQLYVCLCEREWWTVDKEDDMPIIRTRVEYKFSGIKPLTFKESYNKPLSPVDRAEYEAAMSAREEQPEVPKPNLPF
jgi:hypothetical protein